MTDKRMFAPTSSWSARRDDEIDAIQASIALAEMSGDLDAVIKANRELIAAVKRKSCRQPDDSGISRLQRWLEPFRRPPER